MPRPKGQVEGGLLLTPKHRKIKQNSRRGLLFGQKKASQIQGQWKLESKASKKSRREKDRKLVKALTSTGGGCHVETRGQ